MERAAVVTERQLTEQVKLLRNEGSRDQALAALLSLLGDLMLRSGWRPQGAKVARIAQEIATELAQQDAYGMGIQDTSGLGHDDERQRYAKTSAQRVAAQHLRTEE